MQQTARTPWRCEAHDRSMYSQDGFTLIELIIVTAVVPLIIGAITLALISVLSLQGGVTSRISDSSDAQVVSANYQKDVESAEMITTQPSSTPQCGTGTQVLGLEWNLQGTVYENIVSYVKVDNGPTSSLVRQYCTNGSTTPTSTSTVSSDFGQDQSQSAPVVIAPADINASAGAEWTSTIGITGVNFATTAQSSGYSYQLTAVPEATSTGASQVSAVSPLCGFATAGTGTYASTLCFVDLSAYDDTPAPCPGSPGFQAIKGGIAGTPFTLSFCVKVSSVTSAGSQITGSIAAPVPHGTINGTTTAGGFNGVSAVSLATYTDPPTSEAFLGNNGFYTGVPGDPALYSEVEGSKTTIQVIDIQVLDAVGNPATGWGLVTGDAESTDAGESMTWSSDKPLSLIPNSPTSAIGNACAAPVSPDGLTGVGTTTVECAATVSSDKTGTVMLQASTPTTLTVNMDGTGLEAVFLGLLLPGAS
jgi:prepilin-type N-terminal cleavage/methylation domain-containing protein